jgi:hypothetical protein
MKLVRLTKTNFATKSAGLFNNDFNDGIVLKPNSKIALQSVSCDLQKQNLTIDTDNNGITFQIKMGFERNTEMKSFTFNDANSNLLLLNVALALNNKLNWETGLNKVLGMEFEGSITDNGNALIQYRIGGAGEYGDPADGLRYGWQAGKNVSVTGDSAGGQGIYGMSPGSPASDSYKNIINNKLRISKGNGYIRVRPNLLTDTGDNTTNGFIVGLTTFSLNPANFLMQEKFINYGLKMTIDTASGALQFYPIENGVQKALSAVVPSPVIADSSNNDVLEVTIDGSAVDINVYQGASATKTTITTLTYDRKLKQSTTDGGGKNLRPFIGFFADRANCTVTDVRFTPSGFNEAFLGKNENLLSVTQPHTGAVQPPTNASPISSTNNFLQFGSPAVAKYLGFQHERIPRFGTIRASNVCKFIAADQEPFHIGNEIRGFLIQLLNVKLNSYDALRNQRENLLAVIPDLSLSGKLVYSPPTPYFIELNNPEEIVLRNLKARITNIDYTDIQMDGFGQINLLID